MELDPLIREQIFHSAVREYVVFLILFLLLYGASFALTSTFKRPKDEFYSDEEDALVCRISLWMCNFSLAVSLGSALLLPISIVTNEVLLLYPQSYYVQWLNESLIQGLWNVIFLFSNTGVFILLPFAYLFTESEGLPGSRKGIAARVYETFLVLVLLGLVVVGIAYMTSALIECNQVGIMSLFNIWTCYLPFLYSCVSCLGAFMLLICTPIGIGRLFNIVGDLIVKPKFFGDIEDEVHMNHLEELALRRKVPIPNGSDCNGTNGHEKIFATLQPNNEQEYLSPEQKLNEVLEEKDRLMQQRRISPWQRKLCYLIVMIILLFLTVVTVLVVVQNTLEIMVGIKGLPLYSRNISLGISSLSALGPAGAAIEIVLILYLWVASFAGFYNLPLFCRLRPEIKETSMTLIIGNCAVVLILSTALPVIARILGITNFDLLGDFGRIDWLGNLYLVLSYNALFVVAVGLCLVSTFTKAMRQELMLRLRDLQFWRKSSVKKTA